MAATVYTMTFVVTVKGLPEPNEPLAGAVRRGLAQKMRESVGEFNTVGVTVETEWDDGEPKPPPEPTPEEKAQAEHEDEVQAIVKRHKGFGRRPN